ncbi:YihY/virulence factor BrkB family protein [Nonlabens ulvanivorans]|uniref:Membrane protein n=1 Tax=Nonlabens ulvanivorans TaxID=906888 RepID=A0A084JX91_NONUL|nr:YihY/virulence factor BrkB family protein [Nonlabens ulvanivorans]KEZ93575.1 ribonuclease BN [Nonlabens ulvanivorans]PRX14158.1 membrane protein [Nonlabens ulvanivorans]
MSQQKFKWLHLPSILWESAKKWNDDDVWQLSASVAYYTILALPGLLVIMINIVGAVWDTEIATGRLTSSLTSLIGYDSAESINGILQAASRDSDSWFAKIVGISTLVFAATGVFYQLQLSLNKIWKLKINPKTPWWKIITDRVKSFGFILVLGFLILISFILSAVIGVLQDWIQVHIADYLGQLALIVNYIVSLAIISFLFGLMFRYLPDARLQWQMVWPGALLTGILFETGKFLLEIYFTQSSPASAYGAAGLIVLLLLWVSYSSLILFYGAEFIKIYASRYGNGISPSSKSLKYREELIITDKGADVTEKEIEELINSDDNPIVDR